MNYEYVALAIFVLFLVIFLAIKRRNLETEKIFFPVLYLLLYRTKVGLKFMNGVAKKYNKLMKKIGSVAIWVCFFGMITIAVGLVYYLIKLIVVPTTPPSIMPALPIEGKGIFYIPFSYWIIVIFTLAIVHEFAHGIIARTYNMKLKSSGFAFLAILVPIIPAAFVEPDEKELKKRPYKQQLSVFAAGPFANIVLAAVVLIIMLFVLAPISNAVFVSNGVYVDSVEPGLFADKAGLKAGEIIKEVNGVAITSNDDFLKALSDKKPGDNIEIKTETSTYKFALGENPKSEGKPYMGVYVKNNVVTKSDNIRSHNKGIVAVYGWFFSLFQFLFVLNLGVGLFNLVPMGPLDGGRMSELVFKKKFGKKKGHKIWAYVGWAFLALVLANLAFAFIR